MHVIIPVAGKGTRLLPHTETTPKPLLTVAGKPVLEHILDRLEGLPIENIIFITGHLKERFESYQTKWPTVCVEQKTQKGTADAINYARPHVHGPVLIIFADTVFDADMGVIESKDADGILWAKEVEDYQRFGVIVHTDGVMERIVEKPATPVSRLANIGLYYIKDHEALFAGIDATLAAEPGKGGEYFLTDAFQHMIDDGKKLLVEEVDGWYDCGTWECLIDTNRILLGQHGKRRDLPGCTVNEPVWIADDAVVSGSVIGPNVTVMGKARIVGSIVTDSIINEGASVEHAVLSDSILSPGAQVVGEPKRVSVGASSKTTL